MANIRNPQNALACLLEASKVLDFSTKAAASSWTEYANVQSPRLRTHYSANSQSGRVGGTPNLKIPHNVRQQPSGLPLILFDWKKRVLKRIRGRNFKKKRFF